MIKYRRINNIREEGMGFYMVSKYVADFYTKIMNGQVRHDSPETLIKYSRDWEYTWVLLQSEVQQGYKTLDCGSGYSPVPFIFSICGAEAHAVDKDIMICSRFKYAWHCIPRIILDAATRLYRSKQNPMFDLLKHSIQLKETSLYARIHRIWKPDFWGRISPNLLKEYNINYIKGDLIDLSYKDKYFDVVSCISVLEHLSIEDQVQGIKEMSRVVKNGGKLIITYDKSRENLIKEFIKESGMTPVEVVYFSKPSNVHDKNLPDIIGLCLIKTKHHRRLNKWQKKK